MKRSSIPDEIGNPVPLPANTGFVLADTSASLCDNPDCFPPGSDCPCFPIAQVQASIDLSDIRLLMFQITSAKKQDLELRIEIAVGDYRELVFITAMQTVPVQTDKNTLVGLDSQAAEAAQPYFALGNTVILSVRPKGSGVTVKVGMQVDGNKVDKGEEES